MERIEIFGFGRRRRVFMEVGICRDSWRLGQTQRKEGRMGWMNEKVGERKSVWKISKKWGPHVSTSKTKEEQKRGPLLQRERSHWPYVHTQTLPFCPLSVMDGWRRAPLTSLFSLTSQLDTWLSDPPTPTLLFNHHYWLFNSMLPLSPWFLFQGSS